MASDSGVLVDLTDPSFSIPPDAAGHTKPYPQAIAFAALSLFVAILIMPPMFWHYRNRNIGATVLVVLAIYANFISFVNAVIWSNDDLPNWYNGVGLCDVEINIEMATIVAFPASLACILRTLARVLDTENAVLMKTESQKRREYAIDIVCCVITPFLEIPLHYIVPGVRYNIFGIAGCVPAPDSSWLTIVLLIIPPFLWTLVDVYYSILILVRLIRYRLTIDSILSHSNTSKSRFFRLYLLCIVCVLGWFPAEIYILYVNILTSTDPYSWSRAHDPMLFRTAVFFPSDGQIFWDRYIWLVGGVIVFFFFGLGKDATKNYRAGLLRLGFGRIFPGLTRTPQRKTPGSSSSQSQWRLLISRGKDTVSNLWTSRSTHSKSASMSVSDGEHTPGHRTFSFEKPFGQSGTGHQEGRKPSFWSRLNSRAEHEKDLLSVPNAEKAAPDTRARISSTVVADPSSVFGNQLGTMSSEHVFVSKDIQQTHEPSKT